MRDDERRFELSPGEEEEEEEGAGNFAGIVVEVQLITGNILKSPLRCFGAAVVAAFTVQLSRYHISHAQGRAQHQEPDIAPPNKPHLPRGQVVMSHLQDGPQWERTISDMWDRAKADFGLQEEEERVT